MLNKNLFLSPGTPPLPPSSPPPFYRLPKLNSTPYLYQIKVIDVLITVTWMHGQPMDISRVIRKKCHNKICVEEVNQKFFTSTRVFNL